MDKTKKDKWIKIAERMNITNSTTRSEAKKNKPDDMHICLNCLKGFRSRKKMKKHLKYAKHYVNSKKITQEFKKQRNIVKDNSDSLDFEKSLTKVTLLEKGF